LREKIIVFDSKLAINKSLFEGICTYKQRKEPEDDNFKVEN